MFNTSEANKCVEASLQLRSRKGGWGWIDGWRGMVESNGGEKVVVVEGMVVEEESGRVEEKRKEKLKKLKSGSFLARPQKTASAERKVATHGLSRLTDGYGKEIATHGHGPGLFPREPLREWEADRQADRGKQRQTGRDRQTEGRDIRTNALSIHFSLLALFSVHQR